jgi:hypothetical protein
MPDFKKGKIYKITNDYNDDVYVGSTCDTLVKRFSVHKGKSNIDNINHRPLYKLMNEIGFERFRIQLICDYPCEDKYQLTQKEGEYIRTLGTLNKNIAGRTAREYINDNRDKKKDYENQRYKTEHRQEWIKNYQTTDKYKSYQSEYEKRRIRPEDHKLKQSEIITCVCGCEVRKDNISNHKKTMKHLNLMEVINSEQNTEPN